MKFGVDEEARDVKATYLDTAGRPVVIVRKHNLVDEHMVDCEVQCTYPGCSGHLASGVHTIPMLISLLVGWLQVTYTFTRTTLFNEPMMLVAAYLAVFFLAILWQRSDFSIAVCAARGL